MKQIQQYIWIGWAVMLSAAALAVTEQADPNSILQQSRLLRRQLMMQTATAVAEKSFQEQQASLAQLIEQVLSLKTPSPLGDPTTPAMSQKAAPTPQTTVTPPTITDFLTDPNTTAKALQTIGPETSVLSPIELADVLYRAGKPEQAVRFYEMALNGMNKDNLPVHQWVLFQTANCLRHTDAARAGTLYEELIRLYPSSVWAAAAKARHQMLIWLEANEQNAEKQVSVRNNNEQ